MTLYHCFFSNPASFSIPHPGPDFEDVVFLELQPPQAEAIVAEMNAKVRYFLSTVDTDPISPWSINRVRLGTRQGVAHSFLPSLLTTHNNGTSVFGFRSRWRQGRCQVQAALPSSCGSYAERVGYPNLLSKWQSDLAKQTNAIAPVHA